jgi:hypothetical protein
MKDRKRRANSTPPGCSRVTWRLTAPGMGFPPPAELLQERPDVPPVRRTLRICGMTAIQGWTVPTS